MLTLSPLNVHLLEFLTFKHQKQPDWETRGQALTLPQTQPHGICFVQEGLESPESD